MFSETVGGQIAWLIPAALVLFVAALVLCGRASRTDTTRSALLLWDGWALVTALVFSFMKGIFHQYYTVALAPGIAGVAAIGAVLLWRERSRLWVRFALAVALASTAVTAVMLLNRTPEFVPWLRWVIGAAAVVGTVALIVAQPKRMAGWTAVVAVLVAIAGPIAYSIETIATAHSGGIVLAGPKTKGGFGFGPGAICGPGAPAATGVVPGAPIGPGGQCRGSVDPNGGPTGSDMAGPQRPGPDPSMPPAGPPESGAQAGPPGMPGMGPRTNQQLVNLLKDTGGGYTWAAAAVSSMGAADLQLDSGYAVMPIGGFGGGDPAPTLDRFRTYVEQGRIHYFVGSQRRGPGGSQRRTSASEIAQWVEQHYAARDVGGTKVYDLTAPMGQRP